MSSEATDQVVGQTSLIRDEKRASSIHASVSLSHIF